MSGYCITVALSQYQLSREGESNHVLLQDLWYCVYGIPKFLILCEAVKNWEKIVLLERYMRVNTSTESSKNGRCGPCKLKSGIFMLHAHVAKTVNKNNMIKYEVL